MSGVQFCSSYTYPAILYCTFFSIFSLLCKCISLQLQQVIFHTFEKKKTYLKDIDKSWCCNNAFKLQQQCYRYIFMMGQCYDFGETFPLRNFSVRLGQVKTQKNGYVTLLECFIEAPAKSAIKEVFYQAIVFLFTKHSCCNSNFGWQSLPYLLLTSMLHQENSIFVKNNFQCLIIL